jgi:Caudovirus prohead serine protease
MFDEERTVTATLLLGRAVERAGLRCRFEISDAAVDLDEAVGIPVCDAHGEVLGEVDDVWIEDGELRAELSFAETIAGEAALRVVKRGEITGISIGNTILEWDEVGPDSYVATDWELREVSICEEPLDRGARVHGYGIFDIRERMRVRQKIALGQGGQWRVRYDDELSVPDDGSLHVPHGRDAILTRMLGPKVVHYGTPGEIL